MLQEMISEYLSPLGFKVVCTSSESKCLEALDKKIFDAVILDTHSSNLSSEQMLQRIRSKGLKTPVVLLSGNYGITSHDDAISLGANGFIEKPFRVKEFLSCVLDVMAV
jgi:DNA-binding response OmpR family regulator